MGSFLLIWSHLSLRGLKIEVIRKLSLRCISGLLFQICGFSLRPYVVCVLQITEVQSDLNIDVSPSFGCIPGGAAVELEIKICPTNVGCFDVKLCIFIRESSALFVRLSGSVEQPRIYVEKVINKTMRIGILKRSF